MADNIKLFNSYLKGFKTIKGSFPIFVSNSSLECKKSEIISSITVEYDLNESDKPALVTSESDNTNNTVIIFDIYDTEDYYYIIL